MPAPTVSKILAALARAGVLVSHRGAKGGYRLARAPREISAADLIAALDGPIALTVCRLLQVDGATLRLEGLDLVDGTPVLDVKPYIPHYDAATEARIPKWAGFAWR